MEYHVAIAEGQWREVALSDDEYGQILSLLCRDTPVDEIAGKTVGIFGFGGIGQAVGRVGHAMGMNVWAAVEPQRGEAR